MGNTVVRLYLVKPSALSTTLTATELNTYGDYPDCPSDYTSVKYLYVNCESIDLVEDKKVKVTRFAGRGSIAIDLREIFSTVVAKNIYLGNFFNDTYTPWRLKVWKYAHNEWNKISPYKTGAVFVYCEELADKTIDTTTNALFSADKEYFKVFKGSSFTELTMIWNKQLPISIDTFGNVTIKQIELEERL